MSNARASTPVTVFITRRVRRGQALAFERLMAGMLAAAKVVAGRIGGMLAVMAATGLITCATTWLAMPSLVRLFARWLYPDPPQSDAVASPPSEDE